MSNTNCFLPNRGFCLNLRVRIVKSLMMAGAFAGGRTAGQCRAPEWLKPTLLE